MNFTNNNNNMNHCTNYINPFVPIHQTQMMPSPCFGGRGGGLGGWMHTQVNNNPTCTTTSTKLPWKTFPTPMDYQVYETFMDYQYETDMMLEDIGHRLNNIRITINIDHYNLVQRLSHLNIDEEDPMEVDDDDDDDLMDYEFF